MLGTRLQPSLISVSHIKMEEPTPLTCPSDLLMCIMTCAARAHTHTISADHRYRSSSRQTGVQTLATQVISVLDITGALACLTITWRPLWPRARSTAVLTEHQLHALCFFLFCARTPYIVISVWVKEFLLFVVVFFFKFIIYLCAG